MHIQRLAAILAAAMLAGCGGGLQAGSSLPHSTTAQQHVRHMKAATRTTKDVLGGTSSFALSLLLLDAPLTSVSGSVQFYAGILGVDAIDTSGDSWQVVANSSPQVVDLLTLRTTAVNLGSGQLPAGQYPAVDLLLDPSTTSVVVNGQTYPVVFETPNHPWWDTTSTIEAVRVPVSTSSTSTGVTATLDFNVFESANVKDGVVHLIPKVVGGLGQPQIHGTVLNAAGTAVSNATVIATDASGNVANTTVTGADGTFLLHGINPGTYTLTVANTYTTQSGVTVTATGADAGAAPSTTAAVGPNGSVNVGTIRD
jgi:hypothetical protein